MGLFLLACWSSCSLHLINLKVLQLRETLAEVEACQVGLVSCRFGFQPDFLVALFHPDEVAPKSIR